MKKLTHLLVLGSFASLTWTSTLISGETLLKMSETGWKYYDSAEAVAKDWNSATFDDAGWKSGQALLGYGDEDVKQEISFGDDETDKRMHAFFRHAFEVKDLKSVKAVVGKFMCDDGAVFYVNGQEVHRFNIPDGEVTDTTTVKFTMGGEAERYVLSFIVDANKLNEGKNVLAIRVHQAAPNSSDLAIDASLEILDSDDAVAAAKKKMQEDQEMIDSYAEQAAALAQ